MKSKFLRFLDMVWLPVSCLSKRAPIFIWFWAASMCFWFAEGGISYLYRLKKHPGVSLYWIMFWSSVSTFAPPVLIYLGVMKPRSLVWINWFLDQLTILHGSIFFWLLIVPTLILVGVLPWIPGMPAVHRWLAGALVVRFGLEQGHYSLFAVFLLPELWRYIIWQRIVYKYQIGTVEAAKKALPKIKKAFQARFRFARKKVKKYVVSVSVYFTEMFVF